MKAGYLWQAVTAVVLTVVSTTSYGGNVLIQSGNGSFFYISDYNSYNRYNRYPSSRYRSVPSFGHNTYGPVTSYGLRHSYKPNQARILIKERTNRRNFQAASPSKFKQKNGIDTYRQGYRDGYRGTKHRERSHNHYRFRY